MVAVANIILLQQVRFKWIYRAAVYTAKRCWKTYYMQRSRQHLYDNQRHCVIVSIIMIPESFRIFIAKNERWIYWKPWIMKHWNRFLIGSIYCQFLRSRIGWFHGCIDEFEYINEHYLIWNKRIRGRPQDVTKPQRSILELPTELGWRLELSLQSKRHRQVIYHSTVILMKKRTFGVQCR
jgi:hypothetical protein